MFVLSERRCSEGQVSCEGGVQTKQILGGAAEPSRQAPVLRAPVQSRRSLFLCCPFHSWPGVTSVGLVGVSGYGAVTAAGTAAALLLLAQLQPLTRVVALPQPRSLEDLLHQLLKGTLDAIFGLCAGL